MDRTQLFDTLSNLSPAAFERLLIAVNMPRMNRAGASAKIGDQVSALLEWAESPIGPGVEAIARHLTELNHFEFDAYLRSLVATYKKWWEYYTLTDAVSRVEQPTPEKPSVFDFGLMVQTVVKETDSPSSDPRTEERAKTERLPVLEGIRQYANDHVLLVGRPGSGKSTALIRLLLEEAALTPSPSPKLGRGGQERIPVLVELRYWQTSVIERIQAFLTRHDPNLALDETTLTTLLRQGQFLLLIDGLNELPSDEARTQLATFRRDHPQVPMIFATRDLGLGGDLGIEKKLEMQPLTEAQMKDFIRAYVPDQAEVMLRQLNDRLREFGQTPLLLWMLCEVFQQSPQRQMPTNLAEVFRIFTKGYEESAQRKYEVAALKGDAKPLSDRRLWKEALMTLSALMMQGETQIDFRAAIHRTEAERELGKLFANERFPVRDILDDLLKYHLLQNRTTDQLEFRHQMIQEYYAAEHLLRLLPELSDEQFKRDYLNLLKWTEPIALMLALVNDKAQAQRVVKSALNIDLRLGSRLAGEASSDLQKITVGEVISISVADWLKVELLGETQSGAASIELLSFLTHSNINIAKVAASFIGETHDQEIIDILIKRLDEISSKFFSQKSWGGPDKTGILWSLHVEMLSYISPQSAIDFLRNKLENHGTLLMMTTQAAQILMRLDAKNIIPELLERFWNVQDEENRKLAAGWEEPEKEIQIPDSIDSMSQVNAEILRSLKNTRFTPPSHEWLQRNYILNLLENSSEYELFILDLIQAFDQEPDESLQKQIIQILGKSKHDDTIRFLVQSLEENSSSLRAEAAKQLIKLKSISDLRNLEKLRYLAKHEDWNISWCAAIVLGHLRDSTILPRMIDELENNQAPRIRSTAARILSIIGDLSSIPYLIRAVNNDSDRYVRINAACSLSYFDQKEAIPILLDSLKSPTNADPHPEIMQSLSRFGLKNPLIEIIQSKRLYWQRAAIELGKLAQSQGYGESEILPILLKALEDPGHVSSNEVIDLLSELTDSETLNYLIDALEYPENYTKDIYFPNRVALVLVRCSSEIMADKLPALRDLNKKRNIQQLSWLVPTIQSRCRFYNYEIWQESIQSAKLEIQNEEGSGKVETHQHFYGSVYGLAGNVEGNQIISSPATDSTQLPVNPTE